jgi:hypothetical protein
MDGSQIGENAERSPKIEKINKDNMIVDFGVPNNESRSRE